MPQRKTFDFNIVPEENFMNLKIKYDFSPERDMGTKDDRTWYKWVIVVSGEDQTIFPRESLHKIFVQLKFKAGTEFGLQAKGVRSTKDSSRWITSYVVIYKEQEYPENGKSETDQSSEGRKIPTNKKEILDQENDKGFEAWCDQKKKLYQWTMNMMIDVGLDRFTARYPGVLKDEEKRIKLEIKLLELATPTISTVMISFDRNGGKP